MSIVTGNWIETPHNLDITNCNWDHIQGPMSEREMNEYILFLTSIAPFTPQEYEAITAPKGWTAQDEIDYQQYLRTGVLVP
jgi:hypothetical protein